MAFVNTWLSKNRNLSDIDDNSGIVPDEWINEIKTAVTNTFAELEGKIPYFYYVYVSERISCVQISNNGKVAFVCVLPVLVYLILSILDKDFSRPYLEICLFYFSPKIGLGILCKLSIFLKNKYKKICFKIAPHKVFYFFLFSI